MDIEIVTALAAMESYRVEWQDLFSGAMYQSLFGEPEFCLNWIKHFGPSKCWTPKGDASEVSNLRPPKSFLALARNNGRLDVAMPLRLVPMRASYMKPQLYPKSLGMMPTQSLQCLLNSHAPFTNVLIRKDAREFARNAIDHVLRSIRWQSIDLGLIPIDCSFGRILDSACDLTSVVINRQLIGNFSLRFDGKFADYMASRKLLWSNIRRARERLERDFGALSLETWVGDEAVTRGFPQFVEVDAESWKASDRNGETLAAVPIAKDYYRELVERFAGTSRSYVWTLRLDGKLAAAMLCLESGGMLHNYKTSYKEIFAPKARCRPGFVLLTMVVEFLWNRVPGFNFMNDKMRDEWERPEEQFASSVRIPLYPWRRLLSPHLGFRGA